MNRRQFMAMLAAGAIVTAEGLWVPGKKLISIPKKIEPVDNIVTFTVDGLKCGDRVTVYSRSKYIGGDQILPNPYTTKFVIWNSNSTYSGTEFPVGTSGHPVNNLKDAQIIAKRIGGQPIEMI